jgi:uncharacterized protein YprB with RNaseH-like and TPR domain
MKRENVKLEKFMAEVYSTMPEYYINMTPERFRDECEMMMSIQQQMLETKGAGYV